MCGAGGKAVESDPYITAYVLFGLAQTQQAGVQVSEGAIQRASNYLKNTVSAPDTSPASILETWQLDRLAYENFALTLVARAMRKSPRRSISCACSSIPGRKGSWR